jgi:DNA-binding GntR family transcriptional regulator
MDDLRPESRERSATLTLQTAPQAAAQAIREAIISGELKGGDRVLEQKWSRRLGIGQPTLREALRELEHQGLLRKLHQRGTYVAQLSPEDYRLIQEVRIPLEALAVGKAAKNLTHEAEQELTAFVMTMANSGSTVVDVKSFHDSDVSFHRRIWALANNQYLTETLETITFRLFVFSVVGRWPDTPNAVRERLAAVQQHLGILEGIRSRNAEIASRMFIEHTVQYWNSQYSLGLNAAELAINGVGD